MTFHDLSLGMRLKEQAGWNQLEGDWRRLLAMQPDGCFVAELDGRPVGTTMTCVFGPVAWVAMVLVEESLRRRGVGRALMAHALAFLDGQGVRTVRLDATPLGQPLYEKLGFETEYRLARYHGTFRTCEPASRVSPARRDDLWLVQELDWAVTRTDRRKLLQRLFEERASAMRVVKGDRGLLGYCTARPGANATQIGPCIATEGAGPLLLADAQHRLLGRPVYIDIPETNPEAVAWAESRQLTVQRHLVRMCRGPRIAERGQHLWASSGPEKG
jgi:GNAT superfamily N-acetyltransferase